MEKINTLKLFLLLLFTMQAGVGHCAREQSTMIEKAIVAVEGNALAFENRGSRNLETEGELSHRRYFSSRTNEMLLDRDIVLSTMTASSDPAELSGRLKKRLVVTAADDIESIRTIVESGSVGQIRERTPSADSGLLVRPRSSSGPKIRPENAIFRVPPYQILVEEAHSDFVRKGVLNLLMWDRVAVLGGEVVVRTGRPATILDAVANETRGRFFVDEKFVGEGPLFLHPEHSDGTKAYIVLPLTEENLAQTGLRIGDHKLVIEIDLDGRTIRGFGTFKMSRKSAQIQANINYFDGKIFKTGESFSISGRVVKDKPHGYMGLGGLVKDAWTQLLGPMWPPGFLDFEPSGGTEGVGYERVELKIKQLERKCDIRLVERDFESGKKETNPLESLDFDGNALDNPNPTCSAKQCRHYECQISPGNPEKRVVSFRARTNGHGYFEIAFPLSQSVFIHEYFDDHKQCRASRLEVGEKKLLNWSRFAMNACRQYYLRSGLSSCTRIFDFNVSIELNSESYSSDRLSLKEKFVLCSE